MGPTANLVQLDTADAPAEEDPRSLDGQDYGPLTALLNDDSISEVMVNGPDQVYIERSGKLVAAGVTLASEDELSGPVSRARRRSRRPQAAAARRHADLNCGAGS